MRSKFKYDDISTNIGHIVAAEHNNYYPNATEIKLLVHPLLTGIVPADVRDEAGKNANDSTDTATNNLSSEDPGQISGYGPPVVFTCDSECDENLCENEYRARYQLAISLALFQFQLKLPLNTLSCTYFASWRVTRVLAQSTIIF